VSVGGVAVILAVASVELLGIGEAELVVDEVDLAAIAQEVKHLFDVGVSFILTADYFSG
jgi:hypothetical protein